MVVPLLVREGAAGLIGPPRGVAGLVEVGPRALLAVLGCALTTLLPGPGSLLS